MKIFDSRSKPEEGYLSYAIQTKKIKDVSYEVDIDLSLQTVWREVDEDRRFFTSTHLADYWLKEFLDQLGSENNDNESVGIF